MRGGAVAARRAHNPKVAGSSPAPATNGKPQLVELRFFAGPMGSVVVQKFLAILGFASFKSAQGLSDRTIDSCQRHLQKWLEHQGDMPIHQITITEIITYLDWLRNDYVLQRFGNGKDPLSPKTLRKSGSRFPHF